MAFTTNGLPGGGATTHYQFQYDASLEQTPANPGGIEPARTKAVLAAAETDFAQMTGWFGGMALNTDAMAVNVTVESGGAEVGISPANGVTVKIKPGLRDASHVRYLLVSEVTEVFMAFQGIGWYGDGTEGSEGEGLSRFLARHFLDLNGLGGTPKGFDISSLWLKSARTDYVNTTVGNNSNPNEYSGCSMLFLHYLHSQLGFSVEEIVSAGTPTLAGVYQNLTHDAIDPFPDFAQILSDAYPVATFTAIGGADPDNPFPLPSPRRLSMRGVIASFPQPDAVSARQVLNMTGKHRLRAAMNTRRRPGLT